MFGNKDSNEGYLFVYVANKRVQGKIKHQWIGSTKLASKALSLPPDLEGNSCVLCGLSVPCIGLHPFLLQ